MDVRARTLVDALENAGRPGGHFQVDFLGFQLDERFASFDRVTRVFEPLSDGRFDQGFAERRDANVECHAPLR